LFQLQYIEHVRKIEPAYIIFIFNFRNSGNHFVGEYATTVCQKIKLAYHFSLQQNYSVYILKIELAHHFSLQLQYFK